MGYTTRFDGQFALSKPLTVPQYNELKAIGDGKGRTGTPDAYCQWEPTDDGCGLRWDCGEKFYCYEEWLQWLIVHFFKPIGIDVTGSVRWQGEETEDSGVLSVVAGKVKAEKLILPGTLVTCPECDHQFRVEVT